MSVAKSIEARWSPRAFDHTPVTLAEIRPLLEAAGAAPSAMNEQPWRFVVASKSENPEGHRALADALVEGNRVWAEKAPVLIAAIAKLKYDRNGNPNPTAVYDLGQAVAYFSLQATDNGLYLHQMGGFDPVKAVENLSIPEGFQPVVFLAVGHLGDANTLPEPLKQRELSRSGRHEVTKIAYNGSFGEAL